MIVNAKILKFKDKLLIFNCLKWAEPIKNISKKRQYKDLQIYINSVMESETNSESKCDHYCRKQRYSINTQAVVGANHCFLDVATGFPGSMHSTRSFRQTNLFERAKSGKILLAPVEKIWNVEIWPLILGDGGYPPRNWLVKPFNFTPA